MRTAIMNSDAAPAVIHLLVTSAVWFVLSARIQNIKTLMLCGCKMPSESETTNDTEKMTVMVKVLDQGDIRHAHYELDHLYDQETDPVKKQSLKNVCDALWDMMNWYGVEAIASNAIVHDKEYMGGKI
jgi:hypothetical protein